MAVSREDVVKYIENATMIEISELIKDIEEKFGVTAAAPVAVAAGPAPAGAAPAEAAEEKTEFDVVLVSSGEKKIQPRRSSRLVLCEIQIVMGARHRILDNDRSIVFGGDVMFSQGACGKFTS